MNKSVAAAVLAGACTLAICGAMEISAAQDAETQNQAPESAETEMVEQESDNVEGQMQKTLQHIKVNTEVTPGGQFPQTIEVTLDEKEAANVSALDLTADDFSFDGTAGGWMAQTTHPFTADVSTVNVEGDKLTLGFDTFPEKYFYVEDFTVTCEKDANLTFTKEQVDEVSTPVADTFVQETYENDKNNSYWLFTPENTDEPQPIVIVFHGFGDTNNLLCYRTSVDWAEAENQKVRPCYVMSPTIKDQDYYVDNGRTHIFELVHETVQKMIDEGKVDAKRVYVMGNSFGGMSTLEFLETYPDFAAGAIALCSATNYSPRSVAGLSKITETPIWLAQAEHDQTIPVTCSREAYEAIKKAGNPDVRFTEYDDAQMEEAGGINDPDSTYSFHHVELAVMEDAAYKEWLFAQKR